MSVAPIDYIPKINPPEEFVGPPTDPEDERIEVGVVIVGGGPAGLACAIRLTQLLEEEPALAESLGEVPVALVEKGKTTGSHLLSGAMMHPSALERLLPDVDESDWPTYGTVDKDAVYFMTKRGAIPLKPTPPPFRNHGNHVTSVAQLGRWLGEKAEAAGVYILPETAATKLLVEDGVVRLDYRDATFSPHEVFQEFKTHPMIRKILDGGKRVAWGAKTIPSGGWYAMPKQVWAPGLALAGDGASMVNIPKLKGVHLAMHAGMYAAESIFERLKGGDVNDLSNYQEAIEGSVIASDMHRSRNMRQVFSKGFFVGGALANMLEISGGRFPPGAHFHTHDDSTVDVFVGDRDKSYPKPDGKYTFDKLSSVFATGNATRA